jgi:glycosyltransferase involved in cell wall biosynthesis
MLRAAPPPLPSGRTPAQTHGGRSYRDEPLRVALLTYRGNPYSGGQGVYVRYLSRGLRDLGHDVTVLSGPPYPELDEGVQLARLPSLDIYSTFPPGQGAWRRIRRPIDLYEFGAAMLGFFPEPLSFSARAYRYLRARRDEFDVVHDNQSLAYGLLAVQGMGLPVVSTVHHPIQIDRDYALAAAGSRRERFDLRRWYAFLNMQGVVARRLPRVISVSESSKVETSRAFDLPADRLRVVYNGVDVDRFTAAEGTRREPGRVLVVNSADQEIKGLRLLYDVLEQLIARRPADIRIVGRPKDPVATARELERRGLAGSVQFLGQLSHEDLVAAYASSSVAVVPSLYEGFGLPAAESLSCGVPVVAFAAGALPEVLGPDHTTGRVVPAYDTTAMAEAVAGLLDDPSCALRMGIAGRQRVLERFNWERAAEQTAEVYREAATC